MSDLRRIVVTKLLAIVNSKQKEINVKIARLQDEYAFSEYADDEGNIVLPEFLLYLYNIVSDRSDITRQQQALSAIYDLTSVRRIEYYARDLKFYERAMYPKAKNHK
ncbi:hypothetical protein DICVIV_07292 [Dictyocaulus viviparus]|uniref:Uncharacterized protein n=1 Tax=Dictyocaulus viviparus TaxID=29172 RepID=A0A0D8XPQ8_DICVI|nr:hypothetical protein DICVIV_07292 [Dictyocaulus viviparus]